MQTRIHMHTWLMVRRVSKQRNPEQEILWQPGILQYISSNSLTIEGYKFSRRAFENRLYMYIPIFVYIYRCKLVALGKN